jgi:TRAP-type C4-dicarboxylate transport system substrate-binding protein
MKKRRDKEYFTLSPEVREEFLKHIEENNLNKSKLIETLIEEYMKKVKEK